MKDSIESMTQNRWLLEWSKNTSSFEITIGKIYHVIAISKYRDIYFIYVMGDESDKYPLAFPSELFTISFSEISKYWDCNLKSMSSFEQLQLENHDVCSFKEWKLQGDFFYEKILEEDPLTMKIFFMYRDKILSED